jgi:hypothetical protein
MKSKVSVLHNRRRVLFLLGSSIGLCATNSIGKIGYAQTSNNLPKLKTSADPIKSLDSELKNFDEAIKKVKQKAGNISSADKGSIQGQSKLILSNANSVQNTVSQFINELKSRNEWNKNFDIFVESGFRKTGADPRFIAYIVRQGGARAVMEEAASNTSISLNEYVEFQMKSVNITQSSLQVSLMDILIPPASATYRSGSACKPWFAEAITLFRLGEVGMAIRFAGRGVGCLLT